MVILRYYGVDLANRDFYSDERKLSSQRKNGALIPHHQPISDFLKDSTYIPH